MKIALYARYSTDNQRDASIADQFRVCRGYAEKQGWQIFDEYSDHAIFGASLLRAGIQALIADALRGLLQIVLAEAWIGSPATRKTSPGFSSEWFTPM
jgi:DNA invertase Pin-like site-specific DNA recombinase